MKTFRENRKVWDRIYDKGDKILEVPDEDLVRLIHYCFKQPQNKKLLDLGFGGGNNLIYLLKKGFNCYGCEISSSSLKLTKRKLDNLNLSAELRLLKDRLPYADHFFDVVICWHVLYYNDQNSLNIMIKEIKRVLKKGGKLLVTLIRENAEIVYGADKIGENVYKVNLPSQKGAIIYVARDKQEIKKLFNDFANLKIGYSQWEFDGEIGSHWIIYGEKL